MKNYARDTKYDVTGSCEECGDTVTYLNDELMDDDEPLLCGDCDDDIVDPYWAMGVVDDGGDPHVWPRNPSP